MLTHMFENTIKRNKTAVETVLLVKYYRKHYTLGILHIFCATSQFSISYKCIKIRSLVIIYNLSFYAFKI